MVAEAVQAKTTEDLRRENAAHVADALMSVSTFIRKHCIDPWTITFSNGRSIVHISTDEFIHRFRGREVTLKTSSTGQFYHGEGEIDGQLLTCTYLIAVCDAHASRVAKMDELFPAL